VELRRSPKKRYQDNRNKGLYYLIPAEHATRKRGVERRNLCHVNGGQPTRNPERPSAGK